MSQIIPIEKWYHQQKGKPSPIGDVGRPPTSGQDAPINNGGGGPFGGGNDGPPRGVGNGFLGSGGSGPLGGGSNGCLFEEAIKDLQQKEPPKANTQILIKANLLKNFNLDTENEIFRSIRSTIPIGFTNSTRSIESITVTNFINST